PTVMRSSARTLVERSATNRAIPESLTDSVICMSSFFLVGLLWVNFDRVNFTTRARGGAGINFPEESTVDGQQVTVRPRFKTGIRASRRRRRPSAPALPGPRDPASAARRG